MTAGTDTPTVRTRLTAAGISPERIVEHLAAGRLTVDGRPVEDLDEPAPPPARLLLEGA